MTMRTLVVVLFYKKILTTESVEHIIYYQLTGVVFGVCSNNDNSWCLLTSRNDFRSLNVLLFVYIYIAPILWLDIIWGHSETSADAHALLISFYLTFPLKCFINFKLFPGKGQ